MENCLVLLILAVTVICLCWIVWRNVPVSNRSCIKRIQVRRGNASEWITHNPVLSAGEIGYEMDTNRFKIGDGVTPWNAMPKYFSATD